MAQRISIKLDLVFEDHAEFMKTVDEDTLHLAKVNGADAAQTIVGQLGTVLQKMVPIIDSFAAVSPSSSLSRIIIEVSHYADPSCIKCRMDCAICRVQSERLPRYLMGRGYLTNPFASAFKVIQSQIALDDAVRELVEVLREMAGAAAARPNLGEIRGTVNIIEEIGRTSLDAALLIHRYADPSIRGKPSVLGLCFSWHLHLLLSCVAFYAPARSAKLSASDISSQVEECRKRCAALIAMLHGRVQLDTNARVRGIQDAQKGLLLRLAYTFHSYRSLHLQKIRLMDGCVHRIAHPTIMPHGRSVKQRLGLGLLTDPSSRNGKRSRAASYGSMVVVSSCPFIKVVATNDYIAQRDAGRQLRGQHFFPNSMREDTQVLS